MKYRKILLMVFFLFVAQTSYAHRNFWPMIKNFFQMGEKTVPNAVAATTEAEFSRTLSNELFHSFKNAQKVLYSVDTPSFCTICPSKRIVGSLNQETFNPATITSIYPDVPDLKTPKQLASYFLINNNKLLLDEPKRISSWLTQLAQQSAVLQQEALQMEQPQNLVPWFVQQIPQNTKTLFLGEMHRQETIKRFLTQFLTQLRFSRPKQTIYLFTEFLPSRFLWTPYHDPATHPYGRIWKTAEDMNIQVVGLEPEYVQENLLFLEYKTRNGVEQKSSIWASPEGMRLRNNHYNEVIAQYRKMHPNALFIVYTGANHSQYTSPFSLSQNLPPEETVVTSLLPAQRLAIPPAMLKTEGIRPFFTSLSSEFDFATGGKFPQRVLYWKDKDSAHATGFDIQLKLPTSNP